MKPLLYRLSYTARSGPDEGGRTLPCGRSGSSRAPRSHSSRFFRELGAPGDPVDVSNHGGTRRTARSRSRSPKTAPLGTRLGCLDALDTGSPERESRNSTCASGAGAFVSPRRGRRISGTRGVVDHLLGGHRAGLLVVDLADSDRPGTER